jgi:ubiquinone/menaquinone biosynthesis C-methylase UbiE
MISFNREPSEIKDDIPCFGSDREGDQFDESDIQSWIDGGRFARRWETRGAVTEYRNEAYHALCRKAAELNLPIIDIACGPGLGLIPDIYAIKPDIPFFATDACSAVAVNWKRFFNTQDEKPNIEFASFDACSIPVDGNTFPVITSFVGFGSIRNMREDRMNGVHEIFRVLKPGGYVFTVENEYADTSLIQKVFDLWGQVNWYKDQKMNWHERFIKAGFIIESEDLYPVKLCERICSLPKKPWSSVMTESKRYQRRMC